MLARGRGVTLQAAAGTRRDTLRRWLILSPGVAWLTAFVLVPLGIILVYSVARRGTYGGVEIGFTLSNYARLFDPLYLAILWRSTALAFWTTLACLVLGFPLAYAIAAAPARLKNLLLMLVIIPFWTNFLIRTYAWIIILRTEGLLNGLLQGIGLISAPLDVMYTPTAVLIGFIYTWLPFMVLPLYASLEKIDRTLVEAAQDLGAKGFQITRKVIFPLALPGVASGSMLVFIPALAMFVIPD
ncbi:MAG TPA: ABC transporter permease, partial [Limnochordia bacterium]|nr:ABC transporter permease [Limnochordia bacterium]